MRTYRVWYNFGSNALLVNAASPADAYESVKAKLARSNTGLQESMHTKVTSVEDLEKNETIYFPD